MEYWAETNMVRVRQWHLIVPVAVPKFLKYYQAIEKKLYTPGVQYHIQDETKALDGTVEANVMHFQKVIQNIT